MNTNKALFLLSRKTTLFLGILFLTIITIPLPHLYQQIPVNDKAEKAAFFICSIIPFLVALTGTLIPIIIMPLRKRDELFMMMFYVMCLFFLSGLSAGRGNDDAVTLSAQWISVWTMLYGVTLIKIKTGALHSLEKHGLKIG